MAYYNKAKTNDFARQINEADILANVLETIHYEFIQEDLFEHRKLFVIIRDNGIIQNCTEYLKQRYVELYLSTVDNIRSQSDRYLNFQAEWKKLHHFEFLGRNKPGSIFIWITDALENYKRCAVTSVYSSLVDAVYKCSHAVIIENNKQDLLDAAKEYDQALMSDASILIYAGGTLGQTIRELEKLSITEDAAKFALTLIKHVKMTKNEKMTAYGDYRNVPNLSLQDKSLLFGIDLLICLIDTIY